MRSAYLLVLSLISCITLAADRLLPDYSRVYDSARDPFADGKAAIELAGQTGRGVLIEVGGDWCGWCHVLERLIHEHPELDQALHDNFVLLKVNVSDDNANTEFMDGLPRLVGYPQLFVARGDGSVLHAQDPVEFVREGTYDTKLVLGFLQHWASMREGG